MAEQQTPDTIVLINGLRMAALSWERWGDRYSRRGYRVIARSVPGMEGAVVTSTRRRLAGPAAERRDQPAPVDRRVRSLRQREVDGPGQLLDGHRAHPIRTSAARRSVGWIPC